MAQERHEFQSGEKYFQVVVALDDSDERLRPGMTARVEILSGYVENALTVPILALFEEEGRTVCFVDIRQSYEMREVITGRQNEELVEIKDGLKPGEMVCLIPPPGTAGVTTILLK
jgi:multidrug efflux pump subunit AcrA (membrane-fusion protein)